MLLVWTMAWQSNAKMCPPCAKSYELWTSKTSPQ